MEFKTFKIDGCPLDGYSYLIVDGEKIHIECDTDCDEVISIEKVYRAEDDHELTVSEEYKDTLIKYINDHEY